MEKWQCAECDFIYDQAKGDPDHGDVPGTQDSWVCPDCGASKDQFVKI